jgi:hypothetical protein
MFGVFISWVLPLKNGYIEKYDRIFSLLLLLKCYQHLHTLSQITSSRWNKDKWRSHAWYFLNDKKQWWTYKGICSRKDVDIFEIPNGCQGNQVFFIMVEETWIDVSH